MSTTLPRLWHGGVPDLRPGDLIEPQAAGGRHLIDGCPTCEARRAGQPLDMDDNNPHWVYTPPTATTPGCTPTATRAVRSTSWNPSARCTTGPAPTIRSRVVTLRGNARRRWLRMAGLR